jgi:DNA-binding MarR family transcriptional regulator
MDSCEGDMIEKTLCFFKPNRFLRELFLLLGLEQDATMSQHEIARIAGISSSMAHNYIKQLIEEGLIAVQGETNRTMQYFLTAAGKERMQELLALYAKEVVHLYTIARKEFEKKLCALYDQGLHSAVLFGAAETGELVYNSARHTPLRVIGVVDNDVSKQHQKFGDLEVLPPGVIERLRPDGVIITAFGSPEEIYAEVKHLEERGIVVIRP